MRILTIGTAAVLAACSTTPKYSCGAPLSSGECRSVASIHAAAIAQGASAQTRGTVSGAKMAPATGIDEPIMSAPRTLRIHVLPYQDGEGDLHGASYVYARIGSGEWTYTHNR